MMSVNMSTLANPNNLTIDETCLQHLTKQRIRHFQADNWGMSNHGELIHVTFMLPHRVKTHIIYVSAIEEKSGLNLHDLIDKEFERGYIPIVSLAHDRENKMLMLMMTVGDYDPDNTGNCRSVTILKQNIPDEVRQPADFFSI
tara:strand:- start:14725 stop:15153 length:429 start_codon:yes stop_codon:yes gene_type:complete